MNSNAPNAMIARIKSPLEPPNAVIAKERNRWELELLLSHRKDGLTSLFKEVRVFKESSSKVGCGGILKVGQEVCGGETVGEAF